MESIFVTGGSGFIGSHLCSRLLALGHEVTNYDIARAETRLVRQVRGDIMDYERLVMAMRGHTIVCHLAALIGVIRCLENPEKVAMINDEGVKWVAAASLAAGVQHLIFASSSEVYGEGGRTGALEESMAMKPLSTYGLSKMNAENFLWNSCQRTHLRTTVIRYCNIFGGGQRQDFVIPIFIDHVLNRLPLPVFDDGRQIRNFTFITDAVEGTIKAMFRPGPTHDVFNIASPESVSIRELARRVIRIHGGGSVIYLPFESAHRKSECEVRVRIPSVEKAAAVLNFRALTPLDTGLSETYDIFKRRGKAPRKRRPLKDAGDSRRGVAREEMWKIGWGYTSRCNMTCSFCYSKCVRQGCDEVDMRSAIRFVEDNARFIESINYGTGECPLSDDWFEFVKYVRGHHPGIEQAVTTNGSLAFRVREHRSGVDIAKAIDEVDVSLDFADPDRHNLTRGNARAYQWVLDTLQYCSDAGIIATLVFVGFADTLRTENMEGLFALASRFNSFVRLNILRPTSGVMLSPPSFDQLMSGLEWILQNHMVVSLCDPLFGAICNYPGARREATGISSLRILADGTITPSTYLISEEWRTASISRGFRLSEAHSHWTFRRVRQAPVPKECVSCRVVDTCRGGAIDRRLLHFHSLAERDPFCPGRYGARSDSISIRHFYPPAVDRPSIHDGYLPTLIFAPGRS